MAAGRPTVSVIIPAVDEQADIARCLETIEEQTHPSEEVEVILVDGGSADETVAVASKVAADLHFGSFTVVTNPRRRTSTSLNAGLEVATGDIVVRLDARSRIGPTYVEACVARLQADPAVGVVGGAQVPVPRSDRAPDRGIARALANRVTSGLSRYRRSSTSGPADTVWMGVFRRRELVALGGWDDAIALNEDWDLNARYRADGQVVWFLAEERSGYVPRPNLRRLARQYFAFGRVKGLWWVRGQRPAPRQVALLLAPPAAAGALWLAVRRWGARSLVAVPVVLVAADHLGSREPAPLDERATAAAAVVTYCGSWWIGVIAGAVGELLGVEHEHSVRSPRGDDR
jgi:glycosyltransferase involved in cell wall biosynthesis